jgi:protein dpy-30
VESADGMINPDEPLSTDVDNDILQAVDEEIKGASDPEDALIGYAGKALTRADAGTFMADNTDFENTPDDAHVDNPKSFLEIRETRARLLHRNREGGSRRRKDRAEVIDEFIKTLKKIKMPKTISAGVGGNVGPFGSSIDLAFDMNAIFFRPPPMADEREKGPPTQPCYDDLTEGRAAEKAAMAVHNKLNLHALPVRAYLDQTVVPILLQGLAEVARTRPEDPIDFLAAYLIQNNPQKAAKPLPPLPAS